MHQLLSNDKGFLDLFNYLITLLIKKLFYLSV